LQPTINKTTLVHAVMRFIAASSAPRVVKKEAAKKPRKQEVIPAATSIALGQRAPDDARIGGDQEGPARVPPACSRLRRSCSAK
jgi:hypothetical protein